MLVYLGHIFNFWVHCALLLGILSYNLALYVLQSMWIVYPGQASILQGRCSVSCGILGSGKWLKLATEQAKLITTCSDRTLE
jgi:hypothetical protein